MNYLDTSLIVTAITNEQATEGVQAWLARQDQDQLAISDWTLTEASSALAMKSRMGQLTVFERNAAIGKFNELQATSLTLLAVHTSHFLIAARFVEQQELGLRANDALHLAVAFEHQAIVFSLDQRLIKAGPFLGVPTQSPLASP